MYYCKNYPRSSVEMKADYINRKLGDNFDSEYNLIKHLKYAATFVSGTAAWRAMSVAAPLLLR